MSTMTSWTSWDHVPLEQIRRGLLVYVSVITADNQSLGYVLCEVLNYRADRKKVEVCAVAGDRTCIWISEDAIYLKNG